MATADVWIVLWGVIVGLDLIAGPQVMLSRPLVAGTVAGWLAGDVVAGAAVGMLLELFAMEILPLGSARYPDYGLGAVAGTVVAAGAPGAFGIGLALPVGLAVAWLGDLGIQLVRARNSQHFLEARDRIDAGHLGTIVRVHLAGAAREAFRGFSLVLLSVVVAVLLRRTPVPSAELLVGLAAAGVGVAGAVGTVSALRLAGSETAGRVWLGLGLVVGTIAVLVT